MQLLSSVSSLPFVENICGHCKRIYDNLLDHCIRDCIYLDRPRAQFFQEIFSLGADIYTYLIMQDKQTQVNFLLGAEFPEFLQVLFDRTEPFKKVCIFNIHKMWCIYKAK